MRVPHSAHARVHVRMCMQVLTEQGAYVYDPATDLYSLLKVHEPDLAHCCIDVVLSKDGAGTRPRPQRPAVREQTTKHTPGTHSITYAPDHVSASCTQ